jgi:hypothetical protein
MRTANSEKSTVATTGTKSGCQSRKPASEGVGEKVNQTIESKNKATALEEMCYDVTDNVLQNNMA